MTSWLDDHVEAIRAHGSADDEGSLWMLLLDDPYGSPVVTSVVDDAMEHMDAHLTRNIAMILTEVGANAVLLAVPRQSGRPYDVDRRLWADLQSMVRPPPEILDLVVVGDQAYWSARSVQ